MQGVLDQVLRMIGGWVYIFIYVFIFYVCMYLFIY